MRKSFTILAFAALLALPLLAALKVGDKAPDFSARASLAGKQFNFSLADALKKGPVVVYFYPKDDTPGCTIQGQSFTATHEQFEEAGIRIVGVSQDGVDSHKAFCNKFGFTIDLLADTEASLLGSLGIGQSEYKGTKYWDRTTFVVDPGGVIRAVYEKVSPQGHEQVLLTDIKKLQEA